VRPMLALSDEGYAVTKLPLAKTNELVALSRVMNDWILDQHDYEVLTLLMCGCCDDLHDDLLVDDGGSKWGQKPRLEHSSAVGWTTPDAGRGL
jgi:hypothetical protein